MPAYLKAIPQPKCDYPTCDTKAHSTLFNSRNAPVADYCSQHAQQMLREFQNREDDTS